jgi:hypothetical protein
LPGNGEGGEPSVPCPSGPARRRRWQTWRLQEASAAAEGGGSGADCRALSKAGRTPRHFTSTSGLGKPRADRYVRPGRGFEDCAGAKRSVRRRSAFLAILFLVLASNIPEVRLRGAWRGGLIKSGLPLAASAGGSRGCWKPLLWAQEGDGTWCWNRPEVQLCSLQSARVLGRMT